MPPPPPRGVFLLCDFGCATGTLIDCREDQGRMWWWDQGDRYKLQLTFPEWIQAWLEGRVDDAMTGAARIDDEESWTWPDDW